jgi:hypothetical protein
MRTFKGEGRQVGNEGMTRGLQKAMQSERKVGVRRCRG